MAGRPRGNHPTRDELVQAAFACFLERGYHATTMKQVADAVGTSIAQLYLSFPSKQMLLAAVYGQCGHRLVNDFVKPALQEPGDDWTRTNRVFQAYASFFIEEPDLARLMAFTSLSDLDTDDLEVKELFAEQASMLGELFDLLSPVAGGSSTEPEHLLRWTWAAIYGLAAHRMRLPHLSVDDEDFRNVIASGIRLQFDGLARQRELRAAGGDAS